MDISNFMNKSAPFEKEYGVDNDGYIAIDEVLGKKLQIIDVKPYENEKGEGAFILVSIDGDLRYIATHAIGLVSVVSQPSLVEELSKGQEITATIVRRKSKKNTDRLVYAFE